MTQKEKLETQTLIPDKLLTKEDKKEFESAEFYATLLKNLISHKGTETKILKKAIFASTSIAGGNHTRLVKRRYPKPLWRLSSEGWKTEIH